MIATRLDALPTDFSFRNRWNELAGGNPLRSWQWLTTWWRHYGVAGESQPTDARGESQQLGLFVVHEGHGSADLRNIAAIAPCYYQQSLLRGRVLRLLGDGEVCTDHAGLLVDGNAAPQAVDVLAEHLASRDDWDAIHFESIDDHDGATHELFASLTNYDVQTSSELVQQTWSIELPTTWDDFLSLQSKSHRKQLRRAERRIEEDDNLQWRLVQKTDEFQEAWDALIDLHQRRRNSLGEPGCFASPRWAAFHRDVAAQFLASGQLRLSILHDRDDPIAAEYQLADATTTFAYQGGVDPERLDDQPGRLSLICTIKNAIAEGHTAFDLMRGDEPYKPHWRAVPHVVHDLSAVPPRTISRLRNGARAGVLAAKAKAKRLAGKSNAHMASGGP